MKRVVLDTNVVVAALRSPAGASAEVLRRALDGRLKLLASVPLFLEYEDVLLRPEHLQVVGASAAQMRSALGELAALVEPVRIHFLWRPQLTDPADEMVLEAAVNGRAHTLLTFNRRHYGTAPTRLGLVLNTPAEFIRSLP